MPFPAVLENHFPTCQITLGFGTRWQSAREFRLQDVHPLLADHLRIVTPVIFYLSANAAMLKL